MPRPTPIAIPAGVRCVIVFGGTFDPPHVQHTSGLLVKAQTILGSDAVVLYVPAARSPFKMSGPVATDRDRVDLLRLALGNDERALIWTDELDRAAASPGTPSFMIDTLKRLREVIDVGGRGSEITLRLLIGTDQAVAIHRWREYREVMRMADPMVWLRPPVTDAQSFTVSLKESGVWSDEELAQWRNRIAPLPLLDLSATQVRERLQKTTDALNDAFLRTALPIRVLEAIAARGLYR
jgi:nicotinate-nucleotide adenylyltransferase